MPPDKLTVYAPFLRVMTGLAIGGILRAGFNSAPPACRPLLMLDEAAALGYLEPLEDGMGYLAAYARAMLIFQDLGQLEATYPKARFVCGQLRLSGGVRCQRYGNGEVAVGTYWPAYH